MGDLDLHQFEEMFTQPVPNFDSSFTQCKFYTVSEGLGIGDHFSIIHLNARSVKNKFDNIQSLLTASGVDWSMVCVSESWLKQNQISSFHLDNYNVFASCREEGGGGGSLIYVNNLYETKERKDLESRLLETTFIEIHLPNLKKNIIVGNIYRPPGFQHKLFYEYMEQMLDRVETEKKIVILSGDFNYDLINLNTDQHVLNFNNLLSSYCFFPVIGKPTRVQQNRRSLLDNFYINDHSVFDRSGIIIDDLSDHFPIFMSLNLRKKTISQKQEKVVFDKKKASQLNEFLVDKL